MVGVLDKLIFIMFFFKAILLRLLSCYNLKDSLIKTRLILFANLIKPSINLSKLLKLGFLN